MVQPYKYAVLGCQHHSSGCPFEYDGICQHSLAPKRDGGRGVSAHSYSIPLWCPLRGRKVLIGLGTKAHEDPVREPQFITSLEPYGPKEEQRTFRELAWHPEPLPSPPKPKL